MRKNLLKIDNGVADVSHEGIVSDAVQAVVNGIGDLLSIGTKVMKSVAKPFEQLKVGHMTLSIKLGVKEHKVLFHNLEKAYKLAEKQDDTFYKERIGNAYYRAKVFNSLVSKRAICGCKMNTGNDLLDMVMGLGKKNVFTHVEQLVIRMVKDVGKEVKIKEFTNQNAYKDFKKKSAKITKNSSDYSNLEDLIVIGGKGLTVCALNLSYTTITQNLKEVKIPNFSYVMNKLDDSFDDTLITPLPHAEVGVIVDNKFKVFDALEERLNDLSKGYSNLRETIKNGIRELKTNREDVISSYVKHTIRTLEALDDKLADIYADRVLCLYGDFLTIFAISYGSIKS